MQEITPLNKMLNIEPKPLDRSKYPLLSQIDSPADLRKLQIPELITLCAEIRKFLIEQLSGNPGHFASSMGAVELTVALHYVFDTPHDRIVWDVGHQAYSHKLITGRAPYFYANRKLNGLSGFPNPNESEYDTFSAGHASNSISAALGMSVASQLYDNDSQRNVVAVIGDASIAGGLAFEALNNASNTNNNLLIILNDNDMSIDRNVGSMNSYLAHLTASRPYNDIRNKAYKTLKRLNMVSEKNRGRILRFNNSLKSLITHEQNIFEGLNIRYFGPFDGHNLPTIISVLNDIKNMQGPKLLHLHTIKGKGFAPAEQNPAQWHAPGLFNPDNGQKIKSDTPKPPKYQDVFGNALTQLAENNNKIVGITAAMPSGTSISILQQQFPNRTFDVGISEGHAVTFAGGLAKENLLPYVAIYSSFLQRAYDNIVNDIALQNLPVTFCIDRAGLVGEDGATHHGTLDLAYMSAVPGMTICSPRNEQWLRNLLFTSQTADRIGPWAIRYPRGNGQGGDIDTPMQKIEMGKGEKLRDGSDLTILSLGPIAANVKKAIDMANSQGISVAHYDMVFLKPLDNSIMTQVAQRNKPIITVEDASRKGGLGSAVIEWLADNDYSLPVTRLGIPDRFVTQGTVAQLQKLCGIDAESIFNAILNSIKK